MSEKLLRKYAPMTETAFYILVSLIQENHGYNITQEVDKLTEGEVQIGAGTMYGSLGKFEKDGLIKMTRQADKRNYYQLTDLGTQFLHKEIHRLKRVYNNIKELNTDEQLKGN